VLPVEIELMPIESAKKKKAKLSDDEEALDMSQEFDFRGRHRTENYY
jgi:hypothetical protein